MNNSDKSIPVKKRSAYSSGEMPLPIYQSPFRLVIIIASSVFIFELSVMIFLSFLSPLSMWTEALIDPALLVVLLSPTLYFFLFHPLVTHITERRQAEDALKESEEKYRALMNDAGDAILLADTEGNLVEVNTKAEKLLGYTKKEILNMHFTQIHPKEELDRTIGAFKEIVPKKSVFLSDGVILRKDGKTVPVDITGSAIKYKDKVLVQGIFRDITERKRAEKSLKMVLKEWEDTFNAISDGVWILDPEGRIIRSNGVFERMLGMKTEDVLNQYCYKTVHSTFGFIDACPFKRMKQTGKREIEELEDKERGIWLQVAVDPIRNESGVVTGGVHIVRNITERKKADELSLEKERLEYASKAKSEFLSNMSHEIRTPLNSIIGFSELLEQKTAGELGEKQERYVGNIITSGKFLLDLINDILDLSKVEAGKIELVIEKIAVKKIINDTLTLIKEKATNHKVLLKKEIDPEFDFIEADKLRFRQILFNLLSNAVKFSKEEGGTVTIITKKEEDMAKFSVSDTGIGVREEDMSKLFNEFEQLDSGISRNYGGTGLGLAISKKLVELHGGKIWAESRYGEGSTFTFTLPLVKAGEIK